MEDALRSGTNLDALHPASGKTALNLRTRGTCDIALQRTPVARASRLRLPKPRACWLTSRLAQPREEMSPQKLLVPLHTPHLEASLLLPRP